MNDETNYQSVFVTLVRNPSQIAQTHLLINSIRSFGGALSQCPVWVFESNPQKASCESLKDTNTKIFSLKVPDSVKEYLYGDKVYAGRQAEEMAGSKIRSLIWMDSSCLITHPPLLYDLNSQSDTAIRPVHIQNVGIPASAPLDGFWKKVYETVGVSDIQTTVETFVDRQLIRSYFNSHSFAVNPSIGLLHRWFYYFELLACDREFQINFCQDQQHRVFLHQAVLSTLIVTDIDTKRIRMLPSDYNYPYNLHGSVSPERKVSALNDLVSFTYESRSLDPNDVNDIKIYDPLRTWLNDHKKFM